MAEQETPQGTEAFEFAGWGSASRIADLDTAEVKISHLDQPKKHTLGAWTSTAICGNDITSSWLYVSALCVAQAGRYAPMRWPSLRQYSISSARSMRKWAAPYR